MRKKRVAVCSSVRPAPRALEATHVRVGSLPTAASMARALAAVGGALVGGAFACGKHESPTRDTTSSSASANPSASNTSVVASASASAPTVNDLMANGVDSNSPFASVSAGGSASTKVATAASCTASVHVYPHIQPGIGIIGSNPGYTPGMAGGMSAVNTNPVPGKMNAKLTETAVSISGSEPPDIVRKVVRTHFNQLRMCYEKGLMADPTLHGVVSTSFQIQADGAVPTASVSSTLGNAGVEACMRHVFLTLAFPGTDGLTMVVYPISFTAAGDA